MTSPHDESKTHAERRLAQGPTQITDAVGGTNTLHPDSAAPRLFVSSRHIDTVVASRSSWRCPSRVESGHLAPMLGSLARLDVSYIFMFSLLSCIPAKVHDSSALAYSSKTEPPLHIVSLLRGYGNRITVVLSDKQQLNATCGADPGDRPRVPFMWSGRVFWNVTGTIYFIGAVAEKFGTQYRPTWCYFHTVTTTAMDTAFADQWGWYFQDEEARPPVRNSNVAAARTTKPTPVADVSSNTRAVSDAGPRAVCSPKDTRSCRQAVRLAGRSSPVPGDVQASCDISGQQTCEKTGQWSACVGSCDARFPGPSFCCTKQWQVNLGGPPGSGMWVTQRVFCGKPCTQTLSVSGAGELSGTKVWCPPPDC